MASFASQRSNRDVKRSAIITTNDSMVVDDGDDDDDDYDDDEDAEDLGEVQVISEAESLAVELNPYPRIPKGTVADEHYGSKEPVIIELARRLILSKWPQMKTEFSKCIFLACDDYFMVTDELYLIVLSLTTTGAVKSVAVSSEWVANIKESARNKLGNDRDHGPEFKRDGIAFDGTLVLMLVLPVRLANLKAADMVAVSKHCLCHVIICFIMCPNSWFRSLTGDFDIWCPRVVSSGDHSLP
jgi:hypothetical protein